MMSINYMLYLFLNVLSQTEARTDVGISFLAMGVATGLACIGAGMAVEGTGSAAIASLIEKPETFARVLIFVGLAEGIAIYGLIVSLLIWINLPSLI